MIGVCAVKGMILECYAHQKRCNIFESVRTRKYCDRYRCANNFLCTFSSPTKSLRNRQKITVQIHEKSAQRKNIFVWIISSWSHQALSLRRRPTRPCPRHRLPPPAAWGTSPKPQPTPWRGRPSPPWPPPPRQTRWLLLGERLNVMTGLSLNARKFWIIRFV